MKSLLLHVYRWALNTWLIHGFIHKKFLYSVTVISQQTFVLNFYCSRTIKRWIFPRGLFGNYFTNFIDSGKAYFILFEGRSKNALEQHRQAIVIFFIYRQRIREFNVESTSIEKAWLSAMNRQPMWALVFFHPVKK